MMNFKGTIAGAMLLGMTVMSQSVLANQDAGIKAKITGFEYSDVVDVKISSNGGKNWATVEAGGYKGTWANGDAFAAFCVEISQGLSWGKSLSYTQGTFSSTVANNLTSLANKYYSFVDDAISSAAFQVAIWEIVTETKKGLSLDKGNFEVDNTTNTTKEWVPNKWIPIFGSWKSTTVDDPESLAAIDLAKTWLAGINDSSVAATGDYSLQYLKNSKSQDLVVFTPIAAVPEPATYGMLLLGMGVIAFIARRRRATSIRF
ncbi:PEP-CTERM sorting domain-containing protein [Methylobacillus gramineus]|uniref:PEP-CTERM sorting domain-containing protein n=1 Tax=Methylobacillus gramineus TaxID=755169 RepID=UPI001CFFA9DA|nr:PEP-CTERM sorting domain-containing protein [Methylobacillus gramineus]MCB5186374.1 PEP-CTERM sorting domain-containing protein [Methylobacillus gramineus]